MVKTKEEIIEMVNAIIPDDDSGISILEDLTDTLEAAHDAEEWRIRYEENDALWRKKYRDRFLNKGEGQEEEREEEQEEEISETAEKYEDLFEEVGE